MKHHWDRTIPAISAVALTAMLCLWPRIVSPYGTGGYIAGLQNLYAILGGFFVAALTLLSTAETKALSQPLSGQPRVTLAGEQVPLDRRRFLCLLFGYLAFSCFGLYVLGFVTSLLAPGVREFVPAWLLTCGSVAFLLIYNFWLSHMAIATLVGLYYFTDRLQRPDPELVRDPLHRPAE